MSPLKKGKHTYTTYQGMYGAASPLVQINKNAGNRDSDYLTKSFSSEMEHDSLDSLSTKTNNTNYCAAMSSQHGLDDSVPDKLSDRRKKYSSMKNELLKRSQIVSSYLSKYTKDKEKETERNTSAGLRRTKKYDHIPSKVDTNLRKYTSMTSLDNLKSRNQIRSQSAITPWKRTSSVENVSGLNQRRVLSAQNADEYKYLKPIQGLSNPQQQRDAEAQKNDLRHKSLFAKPLEAFKTLPVSCAGRLNLYGTRFSREKSKNDKNDNSKYQSAVCTLPISQRHEDTTASVSYGPRVRKASTDSLDALKSIESAMSEDLANIKSSYESMADQLTKTQTPVLTTPPIRVEPIKSLRPSITTTSSTFETPSLYPKSADLRKTRSGLRLASNRYYDWKTTDYTGSLTDEYLKDVNNSINTYLGGRSSQMVNSRVNYRPDHRVNGGSNLYKSVSMDHKLDDPSEYGNNYRLKKAPSMDFSASTSACSEYSQYNGRRLGAPPQTAISRSNTNETYTAATPPQPTISRSNTKETYTAATSSTVSPMAQEDTLRIQKWMDSISTKVDPKEREIVDYSQSLNGIMSKQLSSDSDSTRPTTSLLKSRWLSQSMPTDLDDDNKSIKSILKKKKKVRINLDLTKTYLFKSECDLS